MAIINPIPGQENRNSDFLLENGAGIKLNNLSTAPFKISSLVREPERLATIKANARHLGRPQAVHEAARTSSTTARQPPDSSSQA
jgi:processive 1,2-diacylglycerol beta-glucosyltransferase